MSSNVATTVPDNDSSGSDGSSGSPTSSQPPLSIVGAAAAADMEKASSLSWQMQVAITAIVAWLIHWLWQKYEERQLEARLLQQQRSANPPVSRLLLYENNPQTLSYDLELKEEDDSRVGNNNVDSIDSITNDGEKQESDSGDKKDESVVKEKFDDDDPRNSKPRLKSDWDQKRKQLVRKRAMDAARKRMQDEKDRSLGPPPFLRKSGEGDSHPGMRAFCNWCDVQNSLFRDYQVAEVGQDESTLIPLYNPASRRGQVQIFLRVINLLPGDEVNVYWINYQGHEVPKGSISPHGDVWTQTTWIEHPWVFRRASDNAVLLHYIPYRVIPTCAESPTTDPDNDRIGMQTFTLRSSARSLSAAIHNYVVDIDDPILPFPARQYLTTPASAVEWTCRHLHRMEYNQWAVLEKYLQNILLHPNEETEKTAKDKNKQTSNNNDEQQDDSLNANAAPDDKELDKKSERPMHQRVRQIRIANPNFYHNIWQTPALGIFWAIGFVENGGGYLELGSAAPLSSTRIKDVSQALWRVQEWRKRTEQVGTGTGMGGAAVQPEGADGFGRAGYGRAGA